VPELVFFIGKGGVGKTTVSAAYAVREAFRRPQGRVLLVSTDPAHSLADILEVAMGTSRRRLRLSERARMTAWEIDSERLFRVFVDRHRHHLIAAVERGSLFTADEISAFLDTALPGMSEMGALLAIEEALRSGKYETIVVDTAPFGHTLRLFGLPQQFAKLLRFLEISGERDAVLAQHFGGRAARPNHAFLEEWRCEVEKLKRGFAAARVFLVTTAERFALNESWRCVQTLRNADPPMALSGVVLNRVVRRAGRCGICRRKSAAAKDARLRLQKEYKNAALYVGMDPGFPIQGVPLLKQFADSVFGHRAVRWRAPKLPATNSRARLSPAAWPVLAAPLGLVLGKGGVGKTTIAAVLGYSTRQKSAHTVEICSVDPAPSLRDVFETSITGQPRAVLGDRGFRASEMDSVALYRSWVAEIRDAMDSSAGDRSSGVHVDLSYERELFSQLLEIVPPGLDEVLAIFRILELAQGGSRKVVIDMAPTGHALELLRTPERILVWSRLLLKSLASHRKLALAREAAVKIAELEVRARELSRALASAEAAVHAVMLPEPIPDRETQRLLEELRRLRVVPKAIFVNQVIFPAATGDCPQCRNAAAWQAGVLAGLQARLRSKVVYAVPAMAREPAGKRGLMELAHNLWKLS
jgi:arsenite-transporting ATPase